MSSILLAVAFTCFICCCIILLLLISPHTPLVFSPTLHILARCLLLPLLSAIVFCTNLHLHLAYPTSSIPFSPFPFPPPCLHPPVLSIAALPPLPPVPLASSNWRLLTLSINGPATQPPPSALSPRNVGHVPIACTACVIRRVSGIPILPLSKRSDLTLPHAGGRGIDW